MRVLLGLSCGFCWFCHVFVGFVTRGFLGFIIGLSWVFHGGCVGFAMRVLLGFQ